MASRVSVTLIHKQVSAALIHISVPVTLTDGPVFVALIHIHVSVTLTNERIIIGPNPDPQ